MRPGPHNPACATRHVRLELHDPTSPCDLVCSTQSGDLARTTEWGRSVKRPNPGDLVGPPSLRNPARATKFGDPAHATWPTQPSLRDSTHAT
jgi:hypothetical protein